MLNELATLPTGTSLPARMLQMMTGHWVSQAIYVAAKLGIADHLVAGSMSSTELAAMTGSDAQALYRVLRALASLGIFTEATPGQFALTPLAALLRNDSLESMRALAITYNEEQYHAWGDLLHSVRSGKPAFEHQFRMGPFEYYAQHPEADRVLNEALAAYTRQVAAAAVATYDFSSFGTVVDVGGGYGALLAAILQRNPTARGILFDQPHVVAGAEAHLRAAGVADRCRRVGGDFFVALPAGGDVYMLSMILHDWDDERGESILLQCRAVMPERGKLLVIEQVLPSNEDLHFGKWLDLHMLVCTGGQERTTCEYGALFRRTGFALQLVAQTPAGPSVIEAQPV